VPSFDYDEIVATAIEVVDEFGRDVTFLKLDPGPTDAAKPWNGGAPRTAPLETKVQKVCFVEPESLERLSKRVKPSDFVNKGYQSIVIVPGPLSFQQYSEILDEDGSRWRIKSFDEFKPGPTIVISYIRVTR
jgi:hypothetical protein